MLPCRLSKLEPAALRLRMTQGVEWPDRSRPASDQGPVAICIPASGPPRFGIARKLRRVRRRISFQPLLWPMEQVMKCSRSIERDQQKWKPVLPDKRLRLSRDRALIFLKERMIFSPNRSLFGGSCATEPRLFSHIKVFARFVEQNAHNRAPCPSVNSERGQSEGASGVGSVIVKEGVAPGGFIPRSRDAHKVGP